MRRMQYMKVAKLAQVPIGEVVGVEIGGRNLVIINYDGEYFALDGVCTHEQCDLKEGHLEGNKLTCSCHGGQFDVRTGEAVTLPVISPVKIYATRVVDDDVEVEI